MKADSRTILVVLDRPWHLPCTPPRVQCCVGSPCIGPARRHRAPVRGDLEGLEMTWHIDEILDDVTLRVLSFHSDPAMIRREVVAKAARRLAEAVEEIEIDPAWQPLISRFQAVRERYPEIYAHRTLYLWKWLQAAFQITSLQVPSEYFRHTNSLKCR